MAALPDALPMADVNGTPLPVIAPAPTDFGLERAGAELGQVADSNQRVARGQARLQARADAESVRPDLMKLMAANGEQFAQDAPRWNGQPGFAADQMASYTDRAQRFAEGNPDYTPGQRAAFRRLADQATASAGDRALNHEIATRIQTAADAQDVVSNGVLANFQQSYQAAKQPLLDGYDGSQAGLTTAVQGAFDQNAQAALAAAPEALKPGLSAKFSAMRVQETAAAAQLEGHGHDAFVLRNAGDQANGLINTISSNPNAYDSVVTNNLPAIVATMPAGLRKDALTELTGQAAQARVKALIDQNNPGQAVAELNDGRYDAVLKPEQKEGLLASAMAQSRAHGPEAITHALAGQTLRQQMDADTYARLTTGRGTGLNLDTIAAAVAGQIISPEEAAHYQLAAKTADQAFAATGPIHALPTGQVAGMAAAPPPDPADPAYATKLTLWQAQSAAAKAELKARQDPGAWAFASNVKAPTKGVVGQAGGQDSGAMLQGLWQTVLTQGNAGHAGASYAGSMLGAQAAAGIPASSRQIVPAAEASRLAAGVINAPAEQRATAMAQLAGVVNALPSSFKLPDGSIAAPRALLARQLLAAHISPIELSAIVDYGADPAKLGRVVAALNDTTLKGPLPHGQQAQLTGQVKTQLAPYLTSLAAQPGEGALTQARLDRTALVARELMATQHMDLNAAVRTAAADVTGGYRFVDGWRMPVGLAGGTSVGVDAGGLHIASGADLARSGAALMLAGLVSKNGENLYAPGGGDAASQRRLYAAQVQHSARWVTTPDDAGLALVVPHPDGTWDQVADRYGRPIRAGWSELQGYARGQGQLPFLQPPANPVHGPDGKPVAAFSKSAAFGAVSWAVNGQESRFRSGLVSAKGALGQMQVTPETVATWAPRLGLPVDLDRAQHDDAYNRQIGNAALSDNINHYGASGPGLGLAIAAYNAGRGHLDGYTDKTGHHPGWLQTIGDPRTGAISLTDFVNRIPFAETKGYVQAVLPAALGHLQKGG